MEQCWTNFVGLVTVFAKLWSVCNPKLKPGVLKLRIFELAPFIFLYNILGFVRLRWCLIVLSIHLSRHPSIQVSHPGGKRWWRRRRTTTNGGSNSLSKCLCDPNVYAIQSCSLWKTPVVLQFTKSYELILKN